MAQPPRAETRSTLQHHLEGVRACLPRFEASAALDLKSHVLEVRARNRFYRLRPQFLRIQDGEVQYSPAVTEDTIGFIGWLPYFNKQWPEATGKLAFKAFCERRGLRTPRYSRVSAAGMDACLVKLDHSSFGRGMRGPYRSGTEAEASGEGAYFEAFVPGRILKAWFWDARLVCLQSQDMPEVEGDGRSTVRELIEARLNAGRRAPRWQDYADMVAYHGLTLDAVPVAGRRVPVDCRYGATLSRETDIYANVLPAHEHDRIGAQLRDAGPVLFESVPERLRGTGTAYTVDAIADADGSVWLLEMNCNPSLHPDVYLGMFTGLFGAPLPAGSGEATEAPFPQALGAPSTTAAGASLSREEILAIARLDVSQGRTEQALRRLKSLIELPDPPADALALAGRVYAELGLAGESEACYRRYLADRPDAVHECFELGVLLFQTGQLGAAQEHWDALLARAPAHAPTLFYRGLLALRTGGRDEARAHLEALLRTAAPDNAYVAKARTLLAEAGS